MEAHCQISVIKFLKKHKYKLILKFGQTLKAQTKNVCISFGKARKDILKQL